MFIKKYVALGLFCYLGLPYIMLPDQDPTSLFFSCLAVFIAIVVSNLLTNYIVLHALFILYSLLKRIDYLEGEVIDKNKNDHREQIIHASLFKDVEQYIKFKEYIVNKTKKDNVLLENSNDCTSLVEKTRP